MTQPSDLARRQPAALTQTPSESLIPRPVQPRQSLTPTEPRPIVVQIVQQPGAQSLSPADRPSHYITQKSQGKAPQPLPNIQLPNVLALTMSLVIALLLVVGASMFSIALNSYANSVDRVDRARPLIQVK